MVDDDSRDSFDLLVEEFLTKHNRGEKPSIEQYIVKHPGEADRIRRIFPTLLMLEEAAGVESPTSHKPSASIPPGCSVPNQLGGYRVIREIGRGGMGVVLEAEQLSLGRRVALKLIAVKQQTDTSKDVERFRRESATAARLQHANIVPVYDVGCENDFVYYAMQLIPGRPLDEVLDEVRRIRGEDQSTNGLEAANPSTGVALSILDRNHDERPFRVNTSAKQSSAPLGGDIDTARMSLDETKVNSSYSDVGLTMGESNARSYAAKVAKSRNPSLQCTGLCSPTRHHSPRHQTI